MTWQCKFGHVHGNEERCPDGTADQIATLREMVRKAESSLAALKADNAALREGLDRVCRVAPMGKLSVEDVRLVSALVNQDPSPGADLLAELERLRKENARINQACDIFEKNSEGAAELERDNRALLAAARGAREAAEHTGEVCRAIHDSDADLRMCPLCEVNQALDAVLKPGQEVET